MAMAHITLVAFLLLPSAHAAAGGLCVTGESCDTDELSALQHSRHSPGSMSPEGIEPNPGGIGPDGLISRDVRDQRLRPPPIAAVLGGSSAKGNVTLLLTQLGVYVEVQGLLFKDSLISDVCGNSTSEAAPLFMYHVHDLWAHKESYATGADCGSAFTGGHWDPTAACGPATGNPVCSQCKNFAAYNCTPGNFKWWEPNQYNSGIEGVEGNPFACELGDFSNMFGMLEGGLNRRGWRAVKSAIGLAQLSALKGTVSIDNAEPCKPAPPSFTMAGPMFSELRGRSIVFHCGSGYANSGARFACAALK